MTPALSYPPKRSLYSGMILGLIVLALLLQASFLVGLARGRLAANEPVAAPRGALVR